MPKISVIMPVYGVELYIESCLRSIAAQTFSDFELILVDDGCLDRSVELAEAYLRTTALNWRVLHQENAGQGPARDHGIREARGEYVVCIDSDDTVAPCFLQALYEAAFETQSAVVFPVIVCACRARMYLLKQLTKSAPSCPVRKYCTGFFAAR